MNPNYDKIECAYCGVKSLMLFKWTDYYRACCCIQNAVDDERICFNCLGEKRATEIRYRLANPVQCEDCEGTEHCPMSEGAVAARKMNYAYHQKQGGESVKTKTQAYKRGREDGKRGISKNPYIPTENSRDEYREGNARGSEEKSNSEAND